MSHIAPYLEALDKDAWDTVNGATILFTGKYNLQQYLLGAGDSLIESVTTGLSFPRDFTIALNVQVDSLNSGDNILHYQDLGSRSFRLWKFDGSNYKVRWTGSNVAHFSELTFPASLIEDGQDNRFAFTSEWGPGQADTWRIFKNGVEESFTNQIQGSLTNGAWEDNPTTRTFTLGSASFEGKAYRPRSFSSGENQGGAFLAAEALHEYQEGMNQAPTGAVKSIVRRVS